MSVLTVEKQDGIAIVTMNRPEALNAFSVELLRALGEVWPALEQDDEVKLAILTGAGRAFCAGMDLKEAAKIFESGSNLTEAMGFGSDARANIFPSAFTKPVIAAVNGAVVGGAMGLVLWSDIAICAEEALFTIPFGARGVLDPNTLVHLMVRMPPGWAKWMAFSGERIDAQTALRMGLVNEVHPRETLLDRALDMAERILYNAPLALKAMKEKMNLVLELITREALETVGPFEEALNASSTGREGFTAAAEKRKPRFSGQ